MGWTTLRMEVTTPLFNGDADPQSSIGVRVPSLRGAMRFWFRALAGLSAGPDLRRLAGIERSVFGGTDAASPVKLRIPLQPRVAPPGKPDFVQRDLGKWVVYLLGQGLGDLRERSVIRPYIPDGEAFELQLKFTGDQSAAALALASLWLLCAYGGVGARTRRGFGGLRIAGADGPLPPPWDPTSVVTPGLAHYERLTHLSPEGLPKGCMAHLARVAANSSKQPGGRAAWTSPPAYPVLSPQYTRTATSGGATFDGWSSVLAHAGEQLRWFRASRANDNPAARYRPRIKTPEWEDAVHGPDDHFGLGALGLPVVYKDRYVVNADHGGPDRPEPLRRASPLWLRPVGAGSDWRLLSFAFRGQFLPPTPDASVHLWRGNQQSKLLHVDWQDVVTRTDAWIDRMRDDSTFVRDAP